LRAQPTYGRARACLTAASSVGDCGLRLVAETKDGGSERPEPDGIQADSRHRDRPAILIEHVHIEPPARWSIGRRDLFRTSTRRRASLCGVEGGGGQLLIKGRDGTVRNQSKIGRKDPRKAKG
jgi:hypothetical protein